MLAEDQGRAAALAQVVDEPALEALGVLEVDEAEQVDFERRGMREPASSRVDLPPTRPELGSLAPDAVVEHTIDSDAV